MTGPAYVACARQIGAAIQDSGDAVTQPSSVHTNSFRVFLAARAEALNVAVVEHAEATASGPSGTSATPRCPAGR